MHTQSQINTLAAVLDDVEVMPDAMCVSELDGYVAGLLLCPELITPSEWLPEVWGLDIAPAFRSQKQAEKAISAVMQHYNRVAERLASDQEPYSIVLEYDNEDETAYWQFWISGFEQAMRLSPEAWNVYLDCGDRNTETGFAVMASLIDIETLESDLPDEKQAEMAQAAPELIPMAVTAMNSWLKQQQTVFAGARPNALPLPANSNVMPAQAYKIGRNDPCPCGSGKKYKKCCLLERSDEE